MAGIMMARRQGDNKRNLKTFVFKPAACQDILCSAELSYLVSGSEALKHEHEQHLQHREVTGRLERPGPSGCPATAPPGPLHGRGRPKQRLNN